jgi:hypothetical protein
MPPTQAAPHIPNRVSLRRLQEQVRGPQPSSPNRGPWAAVGGVILSLLVLLTVIRLFRRNRRDAEE